MPDLEPASQSLARRMPKLQQVAGTTSVSNHGGKINSSLFQRWNDFAAEIWQELQSVDLTVPVSVDPIIDSYIVGSELGLTARFAKHACDPVNNVFIAINHSMRFADRQVAMPSSAIIPDIVLVDNNDGTPNLKVAMPIKLKTFWTLGIISTYKATIFVKRVGDAQFSISDVFLQHSVSSATKPSTKEAIMGMALMAISLGPYVESDDFDARQLLYTTLTASDRPSFFRLRGDHPSPHQAKNPTHPAGKEVQSSLPTQSYSASGEYGTIFFGENGVGMDSVTVTKLVHGQTKDTLFKDTDDQTKWLDKTKAIFEADWHGEQVIVKCWTESENNESSYLNESMVYMKLQIQNPEGYPFLASGKSCGEICCSSIFPFGYALVISKVGGSPLLGRMTTMSVERRGFIRSQIRRAVSVFRACGLIITDCGPHNILYDDKEENPSVFIIDFEYVQIFRDEDPTKEFPIQPEELSVFGHRKDDDNFNYFEDSNDDDDAEDDENGEPAF
ncbi:hypothetical protein N7495_005992 [Penicillium taxi]|uniref:uncharacterized protein n=1 Tax=Penicillium taxi TaxID=168475 RepID=UPI0025454534|nr:uncharacterized protein N7495_005992 [Penicillium taxi]KAJ5894301.1 hypothetical protein N7495_005992 [Penicillium taxi]